MWALRKAGTGPCNIWAFSTPAWLVPASLICRTCPVLHTQASPGFYRSPPTTFPTWTSSEHLPVTAKAELSRSSLSPHSLGESDHTSLLWPPSLLSL